MFPYRVFPVSEHRSWTNGTCWTAAVFYLCQDLACVSTKCVHHLNVPGAHLFEVLAAGVGDVGVGLKHRTHRAAVPQTHTLSKPQRW